MRYHEVALCKAVLCGQAFVKANHDDCALATPPLSDSDEFCQACMVLLCTTHTTWQLLGGSVNPYAAAESVVVEAIQDFQQS